MVTYRCQECGARWTDIDANNICPAHCGGVGQVEIKKHHIEASKSQEVPLLPHEQVYMRFICRKYEEALAAFVRTLNPDQSFAMKLVSQHQERVRKFEKNLEGLGLPLEIPLNQADEAKVSSIETNLHGAEAQLQAARDMFLELFNTPEAAKAVEERFGSGKD